jgi:hypothetical protein
MRFLKWRFAKLTSCTPKADFLIEIEFNITVD